jgi:hypothetical protein
VNAPVVGATGAVAGYERLRRSAFGERGDEPGLGLLMRRGLRAWIEARVDATANAPTSARGADAHASTRAGTGKELLQLIATMVIGAARMEARS